MKGLGYTEFVGFRVSGTCEVENDDGNWERELQKERATEPNRIQERLTLTAFKRQREKLFPTP